MCVVGHTDLSIWFGDTYFEPTKTFPKYSPPEIIPNVQILIKANGRSNRLPLAQGQQTCKSAKGGSLPLAIRYKKVCKKTVC